MIRLSSVPEPLVDDQGDVRELTAADLARFSPSTEIPELADIVRRGRPPLPEADRKQRVTMYLDRDLVAALKADGRGWQTRANALLRKAKGL
ncbi:BrnA antitoxin family protein [Paracoccus sphaerophysae]|uniref:BrnA antitoxin family protein n=1 Tax=Paracoccus sphaerophysae TaxID=690417 RepID=UPI002353DEF9|nr:BrnA antitoxin family protein [Paracoccus sphaerophysae]